MMFLFGIYNAAETLFKKKARFASIFQQILTFVSCVDGSNVTANSNQVEEGQQWSYFQPNSARFVRETDHQGWTFL